MDRYPPQHRESQPIGRTPQRPDVKMFAAEGPCRNPINRVPRMNGMGVRYPASGRTNNNIQRPSECLRLAQSGHQSDLRLPLPATASLVDIARSIKYEFGCLGVEGTSPSWHNPYTD